MVKHDSLKIWASVFAVEIFMKIAWISVGILMQKCNAK